MLPLVDTELLKWIDTDSRPWKPKDDTPEEIKVKVNDWLEMIKSKQS